jgi:hypothetical protein
MPSSQGGGEEGERRRSGEEGERAQVIAVVVYW